MIESGDPEKSRTTSIAAGVVPVLAAVFASSLGAAHATDVFRCVEAGRVTYSDRVCSDLGSMVTIRTVAATTLSTAPAATLEGLRFAVDNVYNDVSTAITLGMSPRTVLQTMGRPLETRATLQGATLVEYWFYRGVEGRTRVAFQEGRVIRVQAQ